MSGKRYTGSAFTDIATTKKRWNGSAWVDLTVAKRWNGSAWVDLFPDTGNPLAPVANWTDPDTFESSEYLCIQSIGDPAGVCPTTVTFQVTRTFTASNYTSLTAPPITGIAVTIAGNSATFYATVAKRQSRAFMPQLVFANDDGTTILTFQWNCFYDFVKESGGEIP